MTEKTRKEIYEMLKSQLESCSPPMVKGTGGGHHDYALIGNKPVPYGYDKKIIPGMFFASIANRKDSVAFHFFPCYTDGKWKTAAPGMGKYLKGKTCFHFKKTEQVNPKELKALLKFGIKAWKDAGYMK